MNILSTCIAAFLVLSTLVIVDAEAKRFGGGKSLGKQYSMPRTAPPRSQPSTTHGPQTAANANQPRSGLSRWLGPLAGLAAGGLLASLFFGGAFEGIQIMDILLIAALAVGGFFLFRMMRRKQLAPGRVPAYSGMPPAPEAQGMPQNLGGAVPSATAEEDEAPDWFDGPAFLEAAKTHFIRLQAAWDQGDFRDIQEYTTPQLFAELQQARRQLGTDQFTEVVTLDAQLLGVRREGDLAVASIAFSGLIREEERGTANRFQEIWHVQHDWHSSQGDWRIAGIQQVEED